jgi:F0F1-type ATP synthase alpha subunit
MWCHGVAIVVSASDAAPLQYSAPYSGCAMGTFFVGERVHVKL